MSMLLTKRLARSLWRTKLRLSAVVFMVAVGVFAEFHLVHMQMLQLRYTMEFMMVKME